MSELTTNPIRLPVPLFCTERSESSGRMMETADFESLYRLMVAEVEGFVADGEFISPTVLIAQMDQTHGIKQSFSVDMAEVMSRGNEGKAIATDYCASLIARPGADLVLFVSHILDSDFKGAEPPLAETRGILIEIASKDVRSVNLCSIRAVDGVASLVEEPLRFVRADGPSSGQVLSCPRPLSA